MNEHLQGRGIMDAFFAITLQLLLVPTLGLSFAPGEYSDDRLGMMNSVGVTRYSAGVFQKQKRKEGFWSPDGTQRDSSGLMGADDLTDNVSWGWHHPNGIYNSVPVGAPLIDQEMNIYVGADDGIRKFDISGRLLWFYGTRGLLAAAPTLANGTVTIANSTRREMSETSLDDAEAEAELKPKRMQESENDADGIIHDIKEGDFLKVREGMGYSGDGQEFYSAGDIGVITKISKENHDSNAHITWKRTGHKSVANVNTLSKRFRKIHPEMEFVTANMMVGATTSGFVFAIDLEKGEELWVTQVCDEIHGVKGTVTVKLGIVVLASNRCVDRYCYRYRYVTNPLEKMNSIVRALNVTNGASLWTFKPHSPVWNFIPVFGQDNLYAPDDRNQTMFFQDVEGSAYALNLYTGEQIWMSMGNWGTFSQGHLLYSGWHNAVYAMRVQHYDVGNGYEANHHCNPFSERGVNLTCGTWPGVKGEITKISASSGRMLMTRTDFKEPPNSGTMGSLNNHVMYHGRMIITFGHNCHYGASSWMYILAPDSMNTVWARRGPTLWSWYCAGDKEGGDIRRAMGQREQCRPGSWSVPYVDAHGDIYVGNQVGEMQRWGAPKMDSQPRNMELLSTLDTGVAFQDLAIGLAPGVMAVTTCTSLIVFQAAYPNETFSSNASWTTDLVPHLPYELPTRPYGVNGDATYGAPLQHDDGTYFRPYDVNSPSR